MKILALYLGRLRNEAHYQFMLLVWKLFSVYQNVASIVTTLLVELDKLITLEGQLVDLVRASRYTEELATADQTLDKYIVGFNSAINSALHHFDSSVVEAARAIAIRMKAFRKSIEKKPYEEEAAAVKILVADLKSTYQTQIDVLKLNDWVTAISTAQNEFEQLFIQRNVELANRPQEQLREVRKQADDVYHQIVERIDAFVVMNGDAACKDFIAELNKEITYFNEHAHQHAKKDISKAIVASIPDQQYAGEPVIVLPDVTYDGEKLVFSRDYEVSYKNNDKPATATLTIHGKGRFKNVLVTTFNIYESEN
jgi:hypothetical protein